MPQVSIGKANTCGMCKHYNVCRRQIMENIDGVKVWEVYDWGECEFHKKEVIYRDCCDKYEIIDNADDAYYNKA